MSTRERFDRWLTWKKAVAVEAALIVFWIWFMHASIGSWPWE